MKSKLLCLLIQVPILWELPFPSQGHQNSRLPAEPHPLHILTQAQGPLASVPAGNISLTVTF